jgi:hypothetical protein
MQKKFRVWDLYEKRMIYPNKGYQGHYVLSLDGKFTNLQNGAGGDECIVQQYIGLKDVKGNDIYEGDIVKFDDCDYNEKYTKGIAEVIHTTDLSLVDAPCFGLWFKNGFHKNMLGYIEVIGNIFEDLFGDAIKDIENGKVVPLDKALNEPPPSKELDDIMKQVIAIDEERKAWKRMFELQVKLVADLELQKLKLQEKLND